MIESIKIESDNYEVIASGSVMQYHRNAPIKFQFSSSDGPLNFQFNFTKDSSVKEPTVLSKVVEEDNILIIDLVNFDKPFGMGNSSPLSLATIDDRNLYLNYVVTTLGGDEGRKTFHYTWYLDNKEL